MPPEFAQFLAQLGNIFGGQQQKAPDLAGLVTALKAPSGAEAQHLAWQGAGAPSYAGNENSPFNNGFFKTTPERQAIETNRLGTPGFSSLTPGQQAGALMTNQPQDRAAGAIAASASPWQSMGKLPFVPQPLTGPDGTPAMDAANLQQNMQMAAPGGIWSLIQKQLAKKPKA